MTSLLHAIIISNQNKQTISKNKYCAKAISFEVWFQTKRPNKLDTNNYLILTVLHQHFPDETACQSLQFAH